MTLATKISDRAYEFFIPEALELLEQMEKDLHQLSQGASITKIQNLVRAAHTIKGGAAQVELTEISDLACRLEKIFSSLKQECVEIDSELIKLLINAYKSLRINIIVKIESRGSDRDRQKPESSQHGDGDQKTILDNTETVFAQLEEKLGDRLMEQVAIPTASDLGIDVNKFILATQVVPAIEEFKTILVNSNPEQLLEELEIHLELLESFGQMLQIDRFVDIAQKAQSNLKSSPQEAKSIGKEVIASFSEIIKVILPEYSPVESSESEFFELEETIEDTEIGAVCDLEDIFGEEVPLPEITSISAMLATKQISLDRQEREETLASRASLENVKQIKLKTANLFVWQANSAIFTVPYKNIEEHLIPQAGQTINLKDQRFLTWEEKIIPVYQLSELVSFDSQLLEKDDRKTKDNFPDCQNIDRSILVIDQDQQIIALEIEIDSLVADSEIEIKPFNPTQTSPTYLHGYATSKNGCSVLAIDIAAVLSTTIEPKDSTAPLSKADLLEYLNPKSQTAKVEGSRSQPNNLETTLLVVDDSPMWRNIISSTLKKAGYKVVCAEDGKKALQQLQQNRNIKLVITDVEMPNCSGFEFLCNCRQNPQLAKVPVMMLSSCNTDKHRQLASKLGASAYLTKPYKEKEFLETVKIHLPIDLSNPRSTCKELNQVTVKAYN